MSHAPSFFAQFELLHQLPRPPRKRVRPVSKQLYAELRDSDWLSKRAHQVLTALAHFRNRTTFWPTPAELTADMHRRGLISRPDPRLVAPRLSELVRGRVVRRKGARIREGGGVCEQLPTRRCSITLAEAHPIAIREAGSRESRL